MLIYCSLKTLSFTARYCVLKCLDITYNRFLQIRTVECILVRSTEFSRRRKNNKPHISNSNRNDEDKEDSFDDVVSSHSLPDSLCVDSGRDRPSSERSCGMAVCPSWIAPSWAPCQNSKCIAKNTGKSYGDVVANVLVCRVSTVTIIKYVIIQYI